MSEGFRKILGNKPLWKIINFFNVFFGSLSKFLIISAEKYIFDLNSLHYLIESNAAFVVHLFCSFEEAVFVVGF